MAVLKNASQSSSDEPAAVACNLLDQVTPFLVANSLLSTQNEAAALVAEAARLAKKASLDQARIAALTASAAALRQASPAIISLFEMTRSSRAPAPANSALVAGRVFNQDSNVGIQNATVLAENPQGAAMARTVTDARGSFELQLDQKSIAAVVLEVKVGRNTVFADPKSAKLVVGNRYYRDIPVGTAAGGQSVASSSVSKPGSKPKKTTSKKSKTQT